MNIIKYQELSKITDYDGNVYFTEKTIAEIADLANKSKFLKVGEDLLAVSAIKYVTKQKSTGIETLPKEKRQYLEKRIAGYKEKFAELPSEKQINHWILTEI